MEEKNEEVVEETTQEQVEQTTPEQVEQTPEEKAPQVDESKFESAGDDSVFKVDLNQPVVSEETETPTNETPEQEQVVLEEITEETTEAETTEEIAVEAEEAIKESIETGEPLPENIQKLVDFMEDTGGDLNDYVKLNQDYSKLDDQSLLHEYYKQTKPHLDNEEINFLMEDNFSFDEDIDDDRDIRRKKLALKEQVADAKSHLDGQKSKYYEEIKAGSKLTQEQQKAIDFFGRYNKESEETQRVVKQNSDAFTKKTDDLFNDKFKGFEYNVGDKKFRFNVKDVEGVKTAQSDLNNFMAKFVDKDLSLKDAKGYHKSLYTAMNADAIANHFYEQGKADAIKTSVAKSKNVDMNPRQSHGKIEAGGVKYKVLGDSSSDFKFKIKNKN
jgi:hypothetical protein